MTPYEAPEVNSAGIPLKKPINMITPPLKDPSSSAHQPPQQVSGDPSESHRSWLKIIVAIVVVAGIVGGIAIFGAFGASVLFAPPEISWPYLMFFLASSINSATVFTPSVLETPMNIGCVINKPTGLKSFGNSMGRLGDTPAAPLMARKVEEAGT